MTKKDIRKDKSAKLAGVTLDSYFTGFLCNFFFERKKRILHQQKITKDNKRYAWNFVSNPQ